MAFPYVPNYGGNWQTGIPGATPITEAALDNLETQFQSVLDLLTTRGDISYRGVATWERLAKGVAGQFLEQGANDPLWANIVEATREIFIPVTYATVMAVKGAYSGGDVDAAADNAYMSFFAPHDFTAIIEAVIVRISNATATHRLNYTAQYGAVGQDYLTHNQSLADQDTNETAGIIYEQDVSGILGALVAGDHVGLLVGGDAVNVPDVHILGFRLKYS